MGLSTSRYSRQIRLPRIGEEGQSRIAKAHVSVVGLGALGSVQAAYLARAGVGRLRLIDRDTVEIHNLQRQVLYTERDVSDSLPKAVAAERHLAAVNSEVRIESIPEHLGSENAEEILSGSDLVLDGTDNFETRYLINDFCVRTKTPWIYGACVGTYGLMAVIVPGKTPCLRCLIAPEAAPGDPTCDTEGILGPVAGIVGSLQAARALQILSGSLPHPPAGIVRIEAWRGTFGTAFEKSRPDPSCPTCGLLRFEFLEGRRTTTTHILCGRDAVQIVPSDRSERDLDATAERLSAFGEVQRSQFLLKARVEGFTLALFPDGRIIVCGTVDPSRARALVDRYLGGA
ncbi:MAG TPA: ThiF family adenylyltransferase [Candidatus Polarisedimenticolia bacterium]|nr:ThiF family adenylyltransferase [Candidatus Polarisedimenticolia bacterium]